MKRTLVVLTLLALGLVPAAMAHVEASPEKVPANGVSKITLSAEGEESVPAVKLTVQMPAGVTDVVAHHTRGWKQSVDGRIVTWSGGQIQNGEDGKFTFSARMPNTPGQVLVFPALVTYQDGKVVHWIGAESSDTPAPRVTLTAAQGQATPPPPPPPAPTATSTAGDGGSDNTWIWILIVAAIGGATAAILVVRRRKRA